MLLTDLMMPGMDGITLVARELADRSAPHLHHDDRTGHDPDGRRRDESRRVRLCAQAFSAADLLPVLTRAMNARHLRLENVQLREAVAIHELSETIAFTLDPQTVLSKLADGALRQSEADEVSILLPTQ